MPPNQGRVLFGCGTGPDARVLDIPLAKPEAHVASPARLSFAATLAFVCLSIRVGFIPLVNERRRV
jgi:hypothetical protein